MKWIAIGVSAFVLALVLTVSHSVPLLHAQQAGGSGGATRRPTSSRSGRRLNRSS